MRIEDAIKHAIDGNALLFLGSGFSVEATPIKGDKFLTGRDLAVHLYERMWNESTTKRRIKLRGSKI